METLSTLLPNTYEGPVPIECGSFTYIIEGSHSNPDLLPHIG